MPWASIAQAIRACFAASATAATFTFDVYVPTTDARELRLSRYAQPEPELKLLLQQLKLTLPEQPPPKITAAQAAATV